MSILLHFDGDECGGMERFLAHAPGAQLVGCELSAQLNLGSFRLCLAIYQFSVDCTQDITPILIPCFLVATS